MGLIFIFLWAPCASSVGNVNRRSDPAGLWASAGLPGHIHRDCQLSQLQWRAEHNSTPAPIASNNTECFASSKRAATNANLCMAFIQFVSCSFFFVFSQERSRRALLIKKMWLSFYILKFHAFILQITPPKKIKIKAPSFTTPQHHLLRAQWFHSIIKTHTNIAKSTTGNSLVWAETKLGDSILKRKPFLLRGVCKLRVRWVCQC